MGNTELSYHFLIRFNDWNVVIVVVVVVVVVVGLSFPYFSICSRSINGLILDFFV